MLKHYLTTALRNFRRHWVTTSVNVVGLALGLACFLGAYSVVRYYALDDSQYAGSDRTYFIMTEFSAMGTAGAPVKLLTSPWVMADFLKTHAPDSAVARISQSKVQTMLIGGKAVEARASYADAEFLKLFPIPFVFGDANGALSQPRSAVINEQTAKRLFGRRDVVGLDLLLDGKEPITIVGVMSSPPQPSHIGSTDASDNHGFELLVSVDVLRSTLERTESPQSVDHALNDWSNGGIASFAVTTYVRLADPSANALASLNNALAAQSKLYPTTANRLFTAHRLREYREHVLSGRTAGMRLSWSALLMAIASCVLVASCLNYANLSAAILLSHRKEIGVRRVIGATSRQLAMQAFVEAWSLIICACALAFAALLATRPLMMITFNIDLIYSWLHSIDMWIALAATLAAVCCMVTVYPIILMRRSQMAAALRQDRSGAIRSSAARWLVAAQFLIASILLIGVFIVHAQHEAIRIFALASLSDPIVTIDNKLSTAGVSIDALQAELSNRPGIASVSSTAYSPWGQTFGLSPLSKSLAPNSDEFSATVVNIGSQYFSTLRIPKLAGEVFDNIGDAYLHSKDIRVVIDRSMSKRLGFKQPADAVDSTFYPGPSLSVLRNAGISLHVVGVVEDRPWQFSVLGASGTVYQRPAGQALTPLVRLYKENLAEGVASVEATWKRLAPNTVLHRSFLDDRIEQYIADRNFNLKIVGWITALSVLIAMTGLIGMCIHAANRRRHEIGIRKTLGAKTVQVIALLLRDFSKPVVIGNVLAWPLAYLATRTYVAQFAYQSAFSPIPFLSGLIFTAVVAGAAVSWQAIAAARVSPANTLRHE